MTDNKTWVERWSALAGLRFLLASIVAVNHLADYMPLGVLTVVPMFGAFEAILGFLLISGYSIGASYMKEPDGFLVRRARRIYPIYLASIVLAYIVYWMQNAAHPPLWELAANVLFLNQIVTHTSFVGPAWSLSLEFWLYCLTPLLFLQKDSTLKKLVWLSLLCFVLHTCARTLLRWNYYSGVAWGANLLLLSFIWIMGLRLARQAAETVPLLRQIGAIFALHILLSMAIQFASRVKHHEIPAFFVTDLIGYVLQAATLVFVWLSFRHVLRAGARQAAPSAWLRTLGDISYPLYLIHIPIYFLLMKTSLRSPILFYLAAVLASAVLYRVLDLYSQRRHLRPAAAAPAPAGVPVER